VPDWLFVPLVLAVAVVAMVARHRSFRRLMRNSGQREDGSFEPGRGPSDMTVVGKVALGVAMLAFVAMTVLRVRDDAPGVLWALAGGVMAVAVVAGLVSERRRIRREGVDVGYGPGRLRPDEPST